MRFTFLSHSLYACFLSVFMMALGACNLLQAQAPIYFEEAVAPILRKNCVACHNAKLAEGGLNLETPTSINKGGDSGASIDASNLEASSLITRPAGTVEPIMPPDGNTVGAVRLTTEQINIIKAWLAGGALSNGTTTGMINQASLKLPESARASYAVAISPDNDFVAFGRAGQLVIHNARRTGNAQPIEGTLDPTPSQVISDAHKDFIYSIAISSDGKTIATGSTGQVKIWRQTTDPIAESIAGIQSSGIPLPQVIAASSDGNVLAIVDPFKPAEPPVEPPASPISTVRIVGRNGALLHSLSIPEPNVAAAAWSPSHNRIYAVGVTNVLYAWDLAVQPIAEPSRSQLPSAVHSIASLDENTVLVVSDRKTSAWQYKTPAAAEPVVDHPLVNAINASGNVDMIAVSPDRLQLVSGTRDDATGNTAMKLWSVPQSKLVGPVERDRKEQQMLLGAERELRRAQATVDRSNAMVGELDKALQAEGTAVTNALAAKEKSAQALTTKMQEMQAAAQAIVDHEKMIADAKAAVEAANLKVTQLTTELEPKKKALADLEKQKSTMQMALDNAAQSLASTEESQKAAQMRLEERKQRVTQQTEKVTASQAIVAQRKAASDAIRFAEQSIAFLNKNVFAAVSAPKENTPTTLDLFSIETAERIETRPVSIQLPSQASLSAVVAPGSQRGWQPIAVIDAPNAILDRATSLAFSPDGSKLAIGSGMPSRNGQLAIINLAPEQLLNGQPPVVTLSLPDLHSDTLLGLAFSPDGSLLASCGADKMTKLVDTTSNAVVKVFEGHTHHVLALAWQEDSSKLATASADATVKIWDIEKGESIRTIAGFGTEVTAIAYVGSTPNIVTSTLNNLVRMHDTNSGNQIKQFGPAPDSLYSVSMSPNGKYAIASGQEGIVRVWFIDDGRLVGEWK